MAPAVRMRERALARLRASASYWLATTRPDGRPHAAPVWGVLAGGEFWFGTAGQKARNLRHTPYAVVHGESADDVAILEGPVERRPLSDAPEDVAAAFRAKYADPLTGGPFELAGAAPPDGEAWLYSLRVEAGRAWLEGAFEETRTRWQAAPD